MEFVAFFCCGLYLLIAERHSLLPYTHHTLLLLLLLFFFLFFFLSFFFSSSLFFSDGHDELMLNVLRCHETS